MNAGARALFLAAMALLYFSFLGTIPLLEPDEGRFAEAAREMLASGDFVTPRLNGVAYLAKPPLHYWGTAASLRLFGETEAGARAFAAAAAAGGILLVYWMGAALAGSATGLYAALVLASSPYYYFIGRLNTPNIALAVALVPAIVPAFLHLSGKRTGRWLLHLSWGAAALAVLTKGAVGLLFPAAVLGLWMVLTGRIREIPGAFPPASILLFLAVALPWFLLAGARNAGFVEYFFVREHLLRYASTIHHHVKPAWYFLPFVAGGFLPWLLFLPRIVRAARASADALFSRDDLVLLLVWPSFILLFFSFSSSKLPTYVAPLFPPLAVLLGRGLAVWAEREEGSRRAWVPASFALVAGAALLAVPRFASHAPDAGAWTTRALAPVLFILSWGAVFLFLPRLGGGRAVCLSFLFLALFLASLNRPLALHLGGYKSARALSADLDAAAGPADRIVHYGGLRPGVLFYTKRRAILVGGPGELAFGAERLADREEWFLGEEAFARLWASPSRVLAVFPRDAMPLIRERFPGHRTVHRSEAGIVVANRP